jgi:hypothetical protein
MKREYAPRTELDHLAHVIEECGEVTQVAGKILRFGWGGSNPELPMDQQVTNKDALLKEVDDLGRAIVRLKHALGEP